MKEWKHENYVFYLYNYFMFIYFIYLISIFISYLFLFYFILFYFFYFFILFFQSNNQTKKKNTALSHWVTYHRKYCQQIVHVWEQQLYLGKNKQTEQK